MKEVNSVCTYCGVGCDITAVVNNNKIEKIYAQSNGVVSQGKLCIKGKFGYDFIDSPNRLKDTLVKKEFIKNNFYDMPRELKARSHTLVEYDDIWYKSSYEFATSLVAWKLSELKYQFGSDSLSAIGGARSNCESAYLLQKFVRNTLDSANIDNCARVCHSPSLKGLKETIGEGAATNPYDDIYKSEFLIIIGSNTTEAHPIVANRIIEAQKKGLIELAVFDVRDIYINRFAKYKGIIPFESNLLILNCIAYVILKEELYNKEFIKNRTKGFEEYKKSILEDEFANPEIFRKIKGYEYLEDLIKNVAREYATKKSMIFWGLGITEHLDGSFSVMAISNLALLTGNIGDVGKGLMPLRGQNNVQGACDMGCLPYYLLDYKKPQKIGFNTPKLLDEILNGNIKAMFIMGEDLNHIHSNQNKVNKAIEKLDFIVVLDLFLNEVAKKADVVFGVKSAYEKTGIYINAMRRLHLSQPIIESNLKDDWEVIRDIENKIKGEFLYNSSEDIWDEVRDGSERFSGASYMKLRKNRLKGMQWPINKTDTPILHTKTFRTDDGLGKFIYNKYQLRGQIKDIFQNQKRFYLTTGRTLVQYNNSAQTKECKRLNSRYSEDLLFVNIDDAKDFSEYVILKSNYGETNKLKIKPSKGIKKGTLFCTFHHSKSKINYLFGDEADVLVDTARFKSVCVEVINI